VATRLDMAIGHQFHTNHFQRTLAKWNRARLGPGMPDTDWRGGMDREVQMLRLEGAFIDELRAEVADLAASAPGDADGFVRWFAALADDGPGQNHPLFGWLADSATDGQMRWFLTQEAAGEAGFDDLVALTQVKMPPGPKLELAENYWDEMGRGQMRGVHGLLLGELATAMAITPDIDATVWESLALANAMTAMATTRRHAWLSIGALGVVELTAPWRCTHVSAGLKRLGHGQRARLYYDLHAHIDIKHSAGWNAHVLHPLVAEDPARARPIAEGALIRMVCAARCFDRYAALLEGGAEAA